MLIFVREVCERVIDSGGWVWVGEGTVRRKDRRGDQIEFMYGHRERGSGRVSGRRESPIVTGKSTCSDLWFLVTLLTESGKTRGYCFTITHTH